MQTVENNFLYCCIMWFSTQNGQFHSDSSINIMDFPLFRVVFSEHQNLNAVFFRSNKEAAALLPTCDQTVEAETIGLDGATKRQGVRLFWLSGYHPLLPVSFVRVN